MSPGIEPHGGGQRDGLRHLTLWDRRIRHAAPQDSLQEPEIVTDDPPMRRCNRQHVEAPEGIVGDDGGRDRQSAALDGDADHDVEVPIPLGQDQHVGFSMLDEEEIQPLPGPDLLRVRSAVSADALDAERRGHRIAETERQPHKGAGGAGHEIPRLKRGDRDGKQDRLHIVEVEIRDRPQGSGKAHGGQRPVST